MRQISCYFQSHIPKFLSLSTEAILGEITQNNEFALSEFQRNTWLFQIKQLKQQLEKIDGHIIFEYTIPRIGKRLDIVIISNDILFAIEYKVGSQTFDANSINQLMDYVLDLKNFHEASHYATIIPVLVATRAINPSINLEKYPDYIYAPILTNGTNLSQIFQVKFEKIPSKKSISANEWISSRYKPTPTIIEAAQALYENHSVEEISRSEAGIVNLSDTVSVIEKIINSSKQNNEKSICFITGVPGSGKTLAGLNIANHWHDVENDEHAVFLSGNGPLVKVLQEALSRNTYTKARESGVSTTRKEEKRKVTAFIQNVHHFRDATWNDYDHPPIEHVTIFDEAQRAWNAKKTIDFMNRKKGVSSFTQSEPAYLISVMDRHTDWAVIICLVGNGQEIYSGEAGINEWFLALGKNYSNWNLYLSKEMGKTITPMKNFIEYHDALHLAVSSRSFRSECVSDFVHHLLNLNTNKASNLYERLIKQYAFYVTRDLEKAKSWLKKVSRGNERYGLITSSNAKRLRPEGFNIYEDIDVENWFLNEKGDVRSSYCMENVATEFDIQGLELDWICVGWGADLRHNGRTWEFKRFRGTQWQNINNEIDQVYLLNAYRVLLTRARQGIILFVPKGNIEDKTRIPEFYNRTYNYLKSIGMKDLPSI